MLCCQVVLPQRIALLVSAWIEIQLIRTAFVPSDIALLVSAWIEITRMDETRRVHDIALLVSAWIEIRNGTLTPYSFFKSHSL